MKLEATSESVTTEDYTLEFFQVDKKTAATVTPAVRDHDSHGDHYGERKQRMERRSSDGRQAHMARRPGQPAWTISCRLLLLALSFSI